MKIWIYLCYKIFLGIYIYYSFSWVKRPIDFCSKKCWSSNFLLWINVTAGFLNHTVVCPEMHKKKIQYRRIYTKGSQTLLWSQTPASTSRENYRFVKVTAKIFSDTFISHFFSDLIYRVYREIYFQQRLYKSIKNWRFEIPFFIISKRLLQK